MNKEELMNKANEMRELMGDELFINELLEAMNSKELGEDLEVLGEDLEVMD